MVVHSNQGVIYFTLNQEEKFYLTQKFFSNKAFIKLTNTGELWGFNYTYPQLISIDQNYFGTIAQRDFYSHNKQQIFKELNLIETEQGIVNKNTYNGGVKIITTPKSGRGLPMLGDYIDGNKIQSLFYIYNVWDDRFNGACFNY